MRRMLLLIDYQKAFYNDNTKGTIKNIKNLVTKHKWDSVVQTLWFNTQQEFNLYMMNLRYDKCGAYDKDSGLVERFKDSEMIPRYDMYSCVDEELLFKANNCDEVYIAGWDTDACVLGTCFGLFDAGVTFKIVADCVASKRQNCHEAAMTIIQRNFGQKVLVTSDEVNF